MTPKDPSPSPLRHLSAVRMAVAAAAGAAGVGLALGLVPEWPWLAVVVAALAAAAAAWREPSAPPAAPLPPLVSDDGLRDAQTGLFRRTAFLALVERDWLRAGRYGGAVALLLVEIDRLRTMTERAGAGVAEPLLTGLGRRVLGSLRGPDLVARFDDAQLAIFLPQADATGALDVADRLRNDVEHLELPGLPPGAPITASIGVAVLRPVHQPMATLVDEAQRALKAARQAGGNCVRLAPAQTLPQIGSPGSWVSGDSSPPSRDS